MDQPLNCTDDIWNDAIEFISTNPDFHDPMIEPFAINCTYHQKYARIQLLARRTNCCQRFEDTFRASIDACDAVNDDPIDTCVNFEGSNGVVPPPNCTDQAVTECEIFSNYMDRLHFGTAAPEVVIVQPNMPISDSHVCRQSLWWLKQMSMCLRRTNCCDKFETTYGDFRDWLIESCPENDYIPVLPCEAPNAWNPPPVVTITTTPPITNTTMTSYASHKKTHLYFFMFCFLLTFSVNFFC